MAAAVALARHLQRPACVRVESCPSRFSSRYIHRSQSCRAGAFWSGLLSAEQRTKAWPPAPLDDLSADLAACRYARRPNESISSFKSFLFKMLLNCAESTVNIILWYINAFVKLMLTMMEFSQSNHNGFYLLPYEWIYSLIFCNNIYLPTQLFVQLFFLNI